MIVNFYFAKGNGKSDSDALAEAGANTGAATALVEIARWLDRNT
ncbi:MAG: hypothetical protein ACI8XB_000796 [Patiriisocius sp.]|jgi:hypothetical protein